MGNKILHCLESICFVHHEHRERLSSFSNKSIEENTMQLGVLCALDQLVSGLERSGLVAEELGLRGEFRGRG